MEKETQNLIIKIPTERKKEIEELFKENGIEIIENSRKRTNIAGEMLEEYEDSINEHLAKDLILEWMVTTNQNIEETIELEMKSSYESYDYELYLMKLKDIPLAKKILMFYDEYDLEGISAGTRDKMNMERLKSGKTFELTKEEVYIIF